MNGLLNGCNFLGVGSNYFFDTRPYTSDADHTPLATLLWQITLVIQSKKIMNALHGCGVPITFQYNVNHEKLNSNQV